MKGLSSVVRRSAGKLFFRFSLVTATVFVLPVHTLHAWQASPSPQRTVQGRVLDKSDAGIRGAVVYLKDNHSLSVRSSFSDANGNFRFGQLAQNTDYDIWAESNGRKSSTKSISSFDSKKEFSFNLKIDTSK